MRNDVTILHLSFHPKETDFSFMGEEAVSKPVPYSDRSQSHQGKRRAKLRTMDAVRATHLFFHVALAKCMPQVFVAAVSPRGVQVVSGTSPSTS